MKTVMIGDIHGRDCWKQIVETEKADRYIFIGDYFDSFDIPGLLQMHNFKELMLWSEQTDAECIFLIGNHDYGYFEGCDGTNTSGYQFKLAPSIKMLVNEWKHKLQMAYRFDDVLCTHAGVSTDFMNGVFGRGGWNADNIVELLNDQWKYKPLTFDFDIVPLVQTPQTVKMSWVDPYGDNVDQSPIWIRPKSLMRSNKLELKKEIIQVVGHTGQRQIDIKGMATGGRYYFIDTLHTSGEYLIYENGNFNINTIKQNENEKLGLD
jgi:hypothetical protein